MPGLSFYLDRHQLRHGGGSGRRLEDRTRTWDFLCVLAVVLVTATMCRGQNPTKTMATPNNNGICTEIFIRNDPSALEKLRGCRVIEGSLQIALIFEGTPIQYKNYSFPELTEVTGYVLLYKAHGLQSLRNLFPNLAVIRGQEFVYNFAFLILDLPDLQEIGLSSLTNIIGRGVYISNNPNLCYVDTVDWNLLTNGSSENVIQKNKPSEQCPNACPDNCPTTLGDRRPLCWTNGDCQIVHDNSCKCSSRLCYNGSSCCSDQCMGGCTGPSSKDCISCKHFEVDIGNNDRICMGHCPTGKYDFLSRRCVTESECANIKMPNARTHQLLSGKLFVDKDKCVLDCPREYMAVSKAGREVCERCNGTCDEVCKSLLVDSIETSKSVKYCTHINGSLKIQIRAFSQNLMRDLTENLNSIKEVDSLIIVNSHFITSLEFLESLEVIHGKLLSGRGNAVEIKSNDNLKDLFGNRSVTISNPDAGVLFHYNPKLCKHIIDKFVETSGINNKTRKDIGITNGDSVPCKHQSINIYEISTNQLFVTIMWDNFRQNPNLIVPSNLLYYEVYYKNSPVQNASIYKDREVYGDNGWTVIESSARDDEKAYEEMLVGGLQPFTQYAFYIKAIVATDTVADSVDAISQICYITTTPAVPSPPQGITLSPISSSSIQVEWKPPKNPNGNIKEYEIYLRKEEVFADFANQRNYCKGRPMQRDLSTEIYPKNSTKEMDNTSSCSCDCKDGVETSKMQRSNGRTELVLGDVDDSIISAVFIAHPTYISSGSSQPNEVTRTRRSVKESQMELYQTVPSNEVGSNGKFKIILNGLSHYTTYTVEIKACRDSKIGQQLNGCKVESTQAPVIDSVNTCSEIFATASATTLLTPNADEIDNKTIKITFNETDRGVVTFNWEEPKKPNGLIMAYRINVTKLMDDSKKNKLAAVNCVTSTEYQKAKNSYSIALHPGKYTVSIQAVSLAQDTKYTSPVEFVISESSEGSSSGIWYAIFIPVFVIVTLGIGWHLNARRRKGKFQKIVSSANPGYLTNVNIPPDWEIKRADISLVKPEKVLGTGSFGEVYEGILKRKGKTKGQFPCAIKTVAEGATSDDMYRFLKEASLMIKMDCVHVVKLFGVVSLSRPLYVVMELMTTDLKKYITSWRISHGGKGFPELKVIIKMAAQIADGMAYLHSKKLLHRDLAARNCLVAQDLTVKVSDFGMTKDVTKSDYYKIQSNGRFPVRWMAPESVKTCKFTAESDTWSYGIVLWEIATFAETPHGILDNVETKAFVENGGKVRIPFNCPTVLRVIMERCWQEAPLARPKFIEILDGLVQYLDDTFAKVSFYHSQAGIEYRGSCEGRPAQIQNVYVNTNNGKNMAMTRDDNLSPGYMVSDLDKMGLEPLIKQLP